MSAAKNSPVQEPDVVQTAPSLAEELVTTQVALAQAQAEQTAATEREKRALADYQNLVRRSQEDRLRVAKLAGAEVVGALLEPLDHLGLAATQLKDKGLDMVVGEFWQVLGEIGLAEIPVMGLPFDLSTMEAVERTGKGEKVTQVVKKGYTLNGEVIQHAKVVLG
jgi:molecular chaperone GrpE